MTTRKPKPEEHVHDWGFWGMPYMVQEVKMACQLRECKTCGVVQERTIGTYRAVNAYTDLKQVLH